MNIKWQVSKWKPREEGEKGEEESGSHTFSNDRKVGALFETCPMQKHFKQRSTGKKSVYHSQVETLSCS